MTETMNIGLLLHTHVTVLFITKLIYWSHLVHLTSLVQHKNGLILSTKQSSWQNKQHPHTDILSSWYNLTLHDRQWSPNYCSHFSEASYSLCFLFQNFQFAIFNENYIMLYIYLRAKKIFRQMPRLKIISVIFTQNMKNQESILISFFDNKPKILYFLLQYFKFAFYLISSFTHSNSNQSKISSILVD